MAGLVYVAALRARCGRILLPKCNKAHRRIQIRLYCRQRDGYIWLDRTKFHAGFCADVPATKADFMAASQVPVGLAAFTTELTVAAWKDKKSWYIVSKQDHMIPPDVERSMAKRAGSAVTEIDASHAVYVSHPTEVAAVIEKAANGSN